MKEKKAILKTKRVGAKKATIRTEENRKRDKSEKKKKKERVTGKTDEKVKVANFKRKGRAQIMEEGGGC